MSVTKPPGRPLTYTIEVSADLVNWVSGPAHTTTISDNTAQLIVRDKIATTTTNMRYIRLTVSIN